MTTNLAAQVFVETRDYRAQLDAQIEALDAIIARAEALRLRSLCSGCGMCPCACAEIERLGREFDARLAAKVQP